jgi:RNA 3'-terminal phosphate cyclase (ATP)
MITIDGSEGEGGGQVLRNSCALSLVTGQPFRITNIRGKRPKPGLMRQHVTAIEAACVISGAECRGLAIGSGELEFRPGKVEPGEYHFAVGTAGSTGLVLQTVLLPLILADGPSRLVLEGGTHNPMAPPFDFIARSYLPVVNRMGPAVSARLLRHGFYPRGGGKIEVEIAPGALRRIECLTRGEPLRRSGQVSYAGVPFEVAERMRARARRELNQWDESDFSLRELPADQGPGIILMLAAEFEAVTELVSGFGQIGTPAERLAKTASARLKGYLESAAFAGPYLADQLVLPFALAGGGSFTTVKLTEHCRTAIAIAERFTGGPIRIERTAEECNLVTFG